MGRRRASGSPSKHKPAFGGGLYPTVAVSDAVNFIGHAWAARQAYIADEPDAALGFALVAEAAMVGTLRFGFSERLLAQANGDLADLAAYVGLPLVGLSFAQKVGGIVVPCEQKAAGIVMLASLGAVCRSLPEKSQELAKVLLNVVCFVAPILAYSFAVEDYQTGLGVLLFALAGIGVGADRESCLLGVRRENWFHYMIAASAVSLAAGLAR